MGLPFKICTGIYLPFLLSEYVQNKYQTMENSERREPPCLKSWISRWERQCYRVQETTRERQWYWVQTALTTILQTARGLCRDSVLHVLFPGQPHSSFRKTTRRTLEFCSVGISHSVVKPKNLTPKYSQMLLYWGLRWQCSCYVLPLIGHSVQLSGT